nr:putative ribonuclease H-like domain-containing protein [Tanacetum cinerariifolium]
DEFEDDRLVVVEQQVVCDMRHSSALDSTSQVSQTFAILVAVEVRTEHSLDDLLLYTDSLVCDMRHSSALDSASQVSQTFAILVAVEVRTEHSLDDLSLCTDSLLTTSMLMIFSKSLDTQISMIRSLMYLTASRPDIMFAVRACARHQVTPKEYHLYVVKRIFRYLRGHPKLGLWYPKDSPFDLVEYSDSDYGGAT